MDPRTRAEPPSATPDEAQGRNSWTPNLDRVRAALRRRRQRIAEAFALRARAFSNYLFQHAPALLFVFALTGGVILGGMIVVVSIGPLRALTLDQKFALLQTVGGATGFLITLFAVAIALEEFRSNRARPSIRFELQTRPEFEQPGRMHWKMRWRVYNEGERACQWFSLELAIGWVLRDEHRFPNGNITVSGAHAPVGGRWSEKQHSGSPPRTKGGFPAWYFYQSNGEVSVFDHVGVEVGGPTFDIESSDREIDIWCILRGSGAPARHYSARIDLQNGRVLEQGESSMPRHRPGAR